MYVHGVSVLINNTSVIGKFVFNLLDLPRQEITKQRRDETNHIKSSGNNEATNTVREVQQRTISEREDLYKQVLHSLSNVE